MSVAQEPQSFFGIFWGRHKCYPKLWCPTPNCTAFQFLNISSFLLSSSMCPGPSAGFAPLSPGDTRAAPRASPADAPGHSGGLKWGNSQVGASDLILILVLVQAKPPWRVWQRWLMCWSQEWQVQEQGCTSTSPGPACPQRLLNHPGVFFMKKMSSKAKHNQKIKLPAWQTSGKVLQAKTQVWWEILSVLSPQPGCPGTPWLQCPAWLHPASPSLGSFPGHSR